MEKSGKEKYEEYIKQVDPEILEKWREEQDKLKTKLVETDQIDIDNIKTIGGMDISASKHQPDVAVVGLVVCDANTLEVLYEKYEFVTMTQPYVPGFLAFREVEHLVKLINDIKSLDKSLLPDVILIDGNGIFHSNRFGLACHLGVLVDIPTIACAKTVFAVDGITKNKVKEIAETLSYAGEFKYLKGKSGAIWGAALRSTDESTDPIIVSIGHRVSLDTGIDFVKSCIQFRVPEPIRIADLRTRELIRRYDKTGKTFNIETYLAGLNQNLYENKK
jgi:deoxyinosine 3'endonuclease (endonuclease V)